MIIARQKRKENIAEYLLYMWQVEDLIRANKFDMDSINRTVIAHYDQPEEVKKEIAQWYEELIEMMRSEGGMEKGHIQLNLLLRMQGKEVSAETLEGIKQISSFLALLAEKYREDMKGELKLED